MRSFSFLNCRSSSVSCLYLSSLSFPCAPFLSSIVDLLLFHAYIFHLFLFVRDLFAQLSLHQTPFFSLCLPYLSYFYVLLPSRFYTFLRETFFLFLFVIFFLLQFHFLYVSVLSIFCCVALLKTPYVLYYFLHQYVHSHCH